jgi:hypothetical protein
LNAASYEPLTALPGAIARSNFARIIPQDERIELNFDFPWEQHGAGFRSREYQNRFFSKEDQLSIETFKSFWGNIQTFGHFIIWDEIPQARIQEELSEPYFMYNIGHDSPYGVSHADNFLGSQKKEERFVCPFCLSTITIVNLKCFLTRLGYHTILSQQQKVREFLNRPRSPRPRARRSQSRRSPPWRSPSPRHDIAPMKRIMFVY